VRLKQYMTTNKLYIVIFVSVLHILVINITLLNGT